MNTQATTIPHALRRTDRRVLASAFLAALFAIEIALAGGATAGSSKSSNEGGRVYNPARLRDSATGPAPGRAMRRPPIPDPENPRPLHSTAKIPSPEPQPRGGSGYVRKGDRFYLEAQPPPTLTRENPNQRIRNSIPNPESPKKHKSVASR